MANNTLFNNNSRRNLFNPNDSYPFRLSRSKIDLFLNCPRCFYLDLRLGIGQPPGFPFTLNSAVDTLLKKEFDIYREKQIPHPIMKEYGVDAIPFQHQDLEIWREPKRHGISYVHSKTNFLVTGGIDDVWINPQKELIIVDYKATSKNSEVNLDADWQIGYKRQAEIYQWLFRQNDFKVSDIAYFVYANARTDLDKFDGKLEFDIKVLPYQGKDDWVEKELINARQLLEDDKIPSPFPDCNYCKYAYLNKNHF